MVLGGFEDFWGGFGWVFGIGGWRAYHAALIEKHGFVAWWTAGGCNGTVGAWVADCEVEGLAACFYFQVVEEVVARCVDAQGVF